MGMRSNDCRERLVGVLNAIDGVNDVDVSLHRARAIIVHESPCTPAHLVWAVVNAGYAAALAGKNG